MKTVISVRVDKHILREAKKVFKKVGISTSAAITLFLHQVIVEQGMPFKPTMDMKKK